MAQILNNTYEILEFVGKGGMSTVFKARHIRLNTMVAVKAVKKDQAFDLLAEVSILTKLNHPNLVRVLDVFEDEKLMYIIMDFIEGEDLQHIIQREKVIPEDTLTDWFITLTDILNYLHTRVPPIIYRDMKPANIILQKDGTLKLVDFGIAREYKASSTKDTTSIGTNGFAAPEQFGLTQSDGRTDIYSLGMTMYYLATGKSPTEPPYTYIPPRQLNPALSEDMERIIEKCIRFNPEERYQSAAELLDALGAEPVIPHTARRKEEGEHTTRLSKIQEPVITAPPIDNNRPVPARKIPVGVYAGIGIFAAAAVIGGIIFSGGAGRRAPVSPTPETVYGQGSETAPEPAKQDPSVPDDNTGPAATEETEPDDSGTEQADDGKAETEPAGDQFLRFGLTGFEGVFNPILSDNVYDSYVTSLLFDGLVDVNEAGEYVPELATWEISADHLTYTFKLKDAVFSNGSRVTAYDVAFTYNTIMEDDYTGPRAGVANAIDYINVVDDKKIVFRMTSASPANLENFTYGILDDKYYAHSSFEELAAKNTEPMGCGIVKFDSWAPKQYVNMVRNDTYYGNKLKIGGVQFLYVEDDSLLAALQNGEIDLCQPGAKAENVDAIKRMDNTHLVSFLANGYTFMCFNTTRAHLAETEVRQALMYALDRKSFLELEYGSSELVSLGMAPISKTSWAYPGDDVLNPYDYDPDKAAKMLKNAGWKLNKQTGIREKDVNGDGEIRAEDYETLEFTWLVYTEATWPSTLSSMAFDSWGQIGVKVNIEQLDFNTVASIAMDSVPGEKDFDIYTMGFSLSLDPDPSWGLFDADAYCEGGFNASGWRNEYAQELIYRGREEFDQAKRAEIYKEWAIIQNEEVPTAVIAYRSEIWAISDRVQGLDDISVYTDFTELIQNVTMSGS